jgi:septum formation protein
LDHGKDSLMTPPLIYLASISPRRRELLDQLGVHHQQVKVAVDESLRPEESAEQYVLRLAQAKAEAGREMIGNQLRRPVLGADTAVVVGHQILGKPADREEGIEMLLRLAGRCHRVLTGVALVDGGSEARLSESIVQFRPIQQQEAQAYWQSGEPADKAGGYAIQGLGALFVSRLEGSFSGVMGLPLFETAELLAQAGIKLLDFSKSTG